MLGNLAKNFSFVVLGRIGSRIADFVLKILIVRSLNPKVFASTVHFQLILNVSLFYVKNCLKNCYQKQSRKNQEYMVAKNSSNLMILGVPITLLFAGIMVLLQTVFNSDSQHLEYFALTSAIYGVSCILQSIYEITICRLVLKSDYRRMTQIEIASLMFKSIVMWISVYFNLFQSYGVLIFGISQVVYSLILMIFGIMGDPQSLKLSKLSSKGQYITQQLKQFVKQFTIVNLIKLVMQQIQKIVMVLVNDVEILSVFTLVSNLGSIIPRFVFQPLEQIAYNIFAKSKNVEEVKFVLEILLKILIVFGSILTVFGTLYSESLITLLYGQNWSTQATITALSSYCFYTLLMGVNGICQAFVYARIQPQSIGKFRNYMAVGTFVYVLSAVLSIAGGYGASGIFLASCLGMIFRVYICWSIFISKFYTYNIVQWIKNIVMKKVIFLVYGITFVGLYQIRNKYHPFVNLMIGAVVAVINLGITAYFERETLRNVKNITKIQNKVQ